MRLVIQKVDKCVVKKNNIEITSIGKGLVFYIGVDKQDTEDIINKSIEWICNGCLYGNDDEEYIDCKGCIDGKDDIECIDGNGCIECLRKNEGKECIDGREGKKCIDSEDDMECIDNEDDIISIDSKYNIDKNITTKTNTNKTTYKHKYTKEIFLLSQFTLFATYKKKNPSFHNAKNHEEAFRIFNEMTFKIQQRLKGINVRKGVFGEELEIIYEGGQLKTFYYEIK